MDGRLAHAVVNVGKVAPCPNSHDSKTRRRKVAWDLNQQDVRPTCGATYGEIGNEGRPGDWHVLVGARNISGKGKYCAPYRNVFHR